MACSLRSFGREPVSSISIAGLKFSRSTARSSSCLSTAWAAGLMIRCTSQPAAREDFQEPDGVDRAAGAR